MPRPKKPHSTHIRTTDKIRRKTEDFMAVTGNDLNQESMLLMVDGIVARQLLSQDVINDNRKQYL